MLPPLGDLHRIECWLLHHGLRLKMDPPAGAAPAWSPLREECIAGLCHGGIKVVLPRGLAPRASAFAKRRAELLHFGSFEKKLRHAGAAPAPAVWKTAVLAVTPMTRKWPLDSESHRDRPGFSRVH